MSPGIAIITDTNSIGRAMGDLSSRIGIRPPPILVVNIASLRITTHQATIPFIARSPILAEVANLTITTHQASISLFPIDIPVGVANLTVTTYLASISPIFPDDGTWPNNEPTGLTAVYSGHPTASGVLLDGSDKHFDYTSAGGSDLGSAFTFGPEWENANRVFVTTEPGSRYPSVIRKNMFIGDVGGWNGNAIDSEWPLKYETLYFRLIFRYSANWQFHASTDKLFYWGKANSSGNAFYINLSEQSGDHVVQVKNQAPEGGDTGVWRSSGPNVVRNRWYTLELLVKSQSALGQSDGSFQVWLDDVEITDWPCCGAPAQNAIEWYASGASTRLFSGIQTFLYYGGSGSTKLVNDHIDFSEFYITGKSAAS